MAGGIDRIGALSKSFEFVYKSRIRGGDFYEFGVYQGLSMIRALKINRSWKNKYGINLVNRFFGFDSFQGLPEFYNEDRLDGYEVFYEGQFSDTSESLVRSRIKENGFENDEIDLVVGDYSSSLKSADTLEKCRDSMAVIVHIDCDLYSSAMNCLKFLDGRILDGTVILFDDWFCYRGRPDNGVRKAFSDWTKSGNYFVSEYFNYSWAGKAFILNRA